MDAATRGVLVAGMIAIKRRLTDPADKLAVSELIDILDADERRGAGVSEWAARHAPAWNPSDREREIVAAFLLGGPGGLSREDIDVIIHPADDDEARQTAAIARVRQVVSRLRVALTKAGSTVTITGSQDGVYRTHDVSIRTLKGV